ncbi:MAG TPA: class I SAM-dependent methyltransferase [Microthrixaceae bacterium]|nr:class I SAM-dependent methyltransferase [Microthrixaceae bacterium]
MSSSSEPWEAHARWWQDEFTNGADPEYTEQILPLVAAHLPATGSVLDIGCGEGQVGRVAASAGLDVVGADPAWAQVIEAQRRGAGVAYVRAGAVPLPFRSESFEAAIACLVFEHIDDLDGALAEVARVLRPGGRFLFLLNHPLLQTPGSGWIDDRVLDPPEQYWRVGPYLPEASTVEQVERGVFIRFEHRPLHRYLNSARARGLVLDHMEEPAPPSGFLERAEEYEQCATIPRLLFLRLSKS